MKIADSSTNTKDIMYSIFNFRIFACPIFFFNIKFNTIYSNEDKTLCIRLEKVQLYIKIWPEFNPMRRKRTFLSCEYHRSKGQQTINVLFLFLGHSVYI